MLLQFTFKYFRSFKDENILDMRATKVKELSHHVRTAGNEKILPITAIYGANASGKSNVLNAISFMTMCIEKSVMFNTENIRTFNFPYNDNVKFSFINNNDDTYSLFEIIFITPNKKKYIYGFIITKHGFKEEWLKQIKHNNELTDIIIRKNYKLEYYKTKQTKIKDNIKTSLSNTSLVLSLGNILKDKLLMYINNWFINISIIDFGEPLMDMLATRSIITNDFLSGKLKDIFLGYLACFDNSIIDYSVKKVLTNESDDDASSYRIYTHHKMLDSNQIKELALDSESSGTQKMVVLFMHFYRVIQGGYPIFIDELNAKLHPLLVRLLLNMFSNPETNPNNAQLIFTTHDSWLMHRDILRRDEIWFTEKNHNGISELYSFVEFKTDKGKGIRNDENYEKNYLLGKYGAIPFLKVINLLEQDNEEEI